MDPDDLLNDSLLDDNGRLTLAYRGLSEIPEDVSEKFAANTRELDLSFNNFSDLHSLKDFTNAHTLILDNNEVKSYAEFPHLPKLTTLWLNKNKISYLTLFVDNISKVYPNLKYLSLMNNLAAPSYFNGGTKLEYEEYRHYVISQLSELSMLDDQPVSTEERAAAERQYMEPSIAREDDSSSDQSDKVDGPIPNEINIKADVIINSDSEDYRANEKNSKKESNAEPLDESLSTISSTRDKTREDKRSSTLGSMVTFKIDNAGSDDASFVSFDSKVTSMTRSPRSQRRNESVDAERMYEQRVKRESMLQSWQGKQDKIPESDSEDSEETEQTSEPDDDEIQIGDLTPAQCEAVWRAFKSFECKDSIDKIYTYNLRQVMMSIGWNLSDKEVDEMKAEIDPEGTGKLTFKGFQKALSKKMSKIDVVSDIKEAFRVFDKDGDGKIPVDEFKYIMRTAVSNITEGELQEMIEDMDVDGDGEIDYKEFANIVKVGRNFIPVDAEAVPAEWLCLD